MIILISSIKGGTGKSTIAFHLAVEAFLQKNDIVTIDLDFPQFSFTRFVENRKKNKEVETWKEHRAVKSDKFLPNFTNDQIYIIDTPGRYDDKIKQLHAFADVIITPINDSFLDIDTIMQIEKERWLLPGYYCEMIFENKKHKKNTLWLVVRNRSSHLHSKHKKLIEIKLEELSKKLNFTTMQGMKERNVFRELFTIGETVLDQTSNKSLSHIAAKMEIKILWKTIADFLSNK